MGDQRHEDLNAHSILRVSEKMADFTVLLDSLEEKFDLPALFVKVCDLFSRCIQIVGQEPEDLARPELDGDDAHWVLIGIAPTAAQTLYLRPQDHRLSAWS